MARLAALAAGLLLFIGTRLTAVVEPIGIDEGIFATAGWGMTRGLMLYRDVWDQKPPGIHLLYWTAFALFGPHPSLIAVLDTAAWTIVAVFTVLIAARLGTQRSAWMAAVLMGIVTFPSFAYPYGGFLERAVPETFIAPLAACAVWATITRRHLLAGLAVGAAAVFKPTALVYWPACVLAAWVLGDDARRAARRMTAPLALPWLVVAAWLWSAGAATDARIAIVDYNSGYVAAGSGLFALPLRFAHEVWRLVKSDPAWLLASAGTVATAVAWLRRAARPATLVLPGLAILWLAAVLLAVAANGIRMYPTYFLPAAAPLALLAGWFLAEHSRGLRALAGAIVLAAAIVVSTRSHAPQRAVRYLAADISRMRGNLAREPYLDLFGSSRSSSGYSARANAELTDYLLAHAAPNDRLYIFGMAPSVYFSASLLPADRFVWTYPAVAPFMHDRGFGVDTLARELAHTTPAWLVLEANNRDSTSRWRIDDVYTAPAIRAFLDGYQRTIVIDDFTVLHRAVQ
jgi:hypothetical protein